MINKVTLIGNAGIDPEIRHLENGTAVGRFSLATNENYKDKDGGWQKQTEWHNVVVWRDLAERAEKAVKKGSLVYVEGKISYRKYTDKDGVEKHTTEIVASVLRALEKQEQTEIIGGQKERPIESGLPKTVEPGPDPSTDLPF